MADRWSGPVGRLNAETSDGRIVSDEGFTVRGLPLPMDWQKFTDEGHDKAVTVATIDRVEVLGDGTVWATGEWLDAATIPEVSGARSLVDSGVVYPSMQSAGCMIEWRALGGGEGDYVDGMYEEGAPYREVCVYTDFEFSKVTLVAVQAFPDLRIGEGDSVGLTAAGVRRSGWDSMPVAPADTAWDAAAAAKRVAAWAGIDEPDAPASAWDKYAGAFLWQDENNSVTASATLTSCANSNGRASVDAACHPMREGAGTETLATSGTGRNTGAPLLASAMTAASPYSPPATASGRHEGAQTAATHTKSVSTEHAPTPPTSASAEAPSNSSIGSTENRTVSAPSAAHPYSGGRMTAPAEAPTSTTITGPASLVASCASAATWESDVSTMTQPDSGPPRTTLTAAASKLPTRSDFKLGVADVVDGELRLIPRGVYAVAGVLNGARGGADIPAADQDALKKVVSGLYGRIAKAMGDDTIEAPFSLVASVVAPEVPPAAWFADPQLTELTPLTITDDGRVFGHSAAWDQIHVGVPGQTPPRSRTGYAYFMHGTTVTDGGVVATGNLTVGGGHADERHGYQAAAEHYDNVGSSVATVAAGEDAFGIWVAGALIPEATESQVRALRRSSLSGDWRYIGGNLEAIAFHAVNTPGFPVPRARSLVADGHVYSLVACAAPSRRPSREKYLAELAEELRPLLASADPAPAPAPPVPAFAQAPEGADLRAEFEAAGVAWPTISVTVGGVDLPPYEVAESCVRGMLANAFAVEPAPEDGPVEADKAMASARARLRLFEQEGAVVD